MCFKIDSICGIKLHTAGIIVGWIGAVLSLLQIIITIGILVSLDDILHAVIPDNNTTNVEPIKHAAISVISIQLAIFASDMISSILLIIGTQKNSHLMILPWLIDNCIVLVFRIILGVIFSVACLAQNIPGMGLTPIIIFIFLGIHCWIWTAIYSLFCSIRADKEQIFIPGNRTTSSVYELINNAS